MSFDITSYELGRKKGREDGGEIIEITGDEYDFTIEGNTVTLEKKGGD